MFHLQASYHFAWEGSTPITASHWVVSYRLWQFRKQRLYSKSSDTLWGISWSVSERGEQARLSSVSFSSNDPQPLQSRCVLPSGHLLLGRSIERDREIIRTLARCWRHSQGDVNPQSVAVQPDDGCSEDSSATRRQTVHRLGSPAWRSPGVSCHTYELSWVSTDAWITRFFLLWTYVGVVVWFFVYEYFATKHFRKQEHRRSCLRWSRWEECVGDYKNVAENQLTLLVLSLMEFIIRPYKPSHKAYERLAKGRLWQRNSTAEFTSSSLSLQFMMTWWPVGYSSDTITVAVVARVKIRVGII